ncbi:MAG: undecaprenyl/decaprenyl-phosphate alpha-N-acetylglucosaminyl 1-phosphate transferase [Acidobacteria bacterium]|nr:MAG: undecaprenyl/decaprenyl-phosphate alpha-N-acetylglucosaminyl 1-phosphate transferase [Acidobacteriota bacterium]
MPVVIVKLTFLVLILSGLSSLVLTPLLRNLAFRRGWVDQPDGLRKMHRMPVPQLGGVAIYLSFVVSFLALLLLDRYAGTGESSVDGFPLIVACAGVMLIGLADDIRGVKPASKLVVQAAAGLYLFFSGYRISSVTNPFGDPVALGSLSLPLTLLWFVGMSNAFNLIDGLDGLAAGIGFFATTTLFVAAIINERWEVVLLCAALAGGLLGFVRYNFNPASIFLGDCGSLFVGFALAAFAIRGSMKSSAAIAVAAPLIALALPIVDASIAMMRRLLRGQSIFHADRDHIHHRMVRMGFTPSRVVIILYGVAALFGAFSLLTMTGRSQIVGLVIIAFSVVTWFGIQRLGYSEFSELHRLLRQRLFQDPRAVVNNIYLAGLKSEFEQALDLAALWRTLTTTASRVDFCQVEIVLSPLARDRLMVYRGAPALPPGFPQWRAPGSPRSAGDCWSWTIPILDAGTVVAELRMGRPVQARNGFELSHLMGALMEGFAPSFIRLLDGSPLPDRRPVVESLSPLPVAPES